MLPPPNFNEKHLKLAEDTLVSVVDVVNASRTRKEQLDRLANFIDDRSGDLEERPQPTTAAKNPDEYKYTVTDVRGTTAYLITTESWHPQTEVCLRRGTEIWRGVLLPRSAQCTVTKVGTQLSAAELKQKLQSI